MWRVFFRRFAALSLLGFSPGLAPWAPFFRRYAALSFLALPRVRALGYILFAATRLSPETEHACLSAISLRSGAYRSSRRSGRRQG